VTPGERMVWAAVFAAYWRSPGPSGAVGHVTPAPSCTTTRTGRRPAGSPSSSRSLEHERSGECQTSYHHVSVAEKQAYARANVREQAVACPKCDTQTTAAELIEHLEKRCTGPREPGPGSKWISLPEAIALGASRRTLFWWTRRGLVRVKGRRRSRMYLLRDMAIRLARRRVDESAIHCTFP
jgi:hypothetical protein